MSIFGMLCERASWEELTFGDLMSWRIDHWDSELVFGYDIDVCHCNNARGVNRREHFPHFTLPATRQFNREGF